MHNVTAWTRPDSYMGAEWYGYYSSGFSQHRDSDALERANFQAAWSALKNDRSIDLGECGPDNDGPTVLMVREGHWAVGWVEWIAIHESDTEALAIARKLCERANDYPILDEELHSRLEDEECEETWRLCYRERERIEYFRTHSYTATSFAALLRAVRGDWYEASNMLHCPSDLL